MNLRRKILSLLTLFPLLGLLGYFIFGTNFYIQDKKSYILDTNLQLAATQASFLDLEWNNKAIPLFSTVEQLKTEAAQKVFIKTSMNELYLIDTQGRVLMSSESNPPPDLQNLLDKKSMDPILNQQLSETSYEGKSPHGDGVYISFSNIGKRPLVFLTLTDKKSIHRSSLMFLIKSFAILVLLVGIAFFASFFLARSLTERLHSLVKTMELFGQGKMDAKMQVSGTDEVGRAASVFNKMVSDLRKLMSDREQSLRHEVEMSTARDVQKQFLPENYFDNKDVSIAGFYESANECGGDWWYYMVKDRKLIACIGDVTGHGVSSALLTAAARSAIAVIEDDYHGPADMMRKLNLAIYETSRGQLQMTFFVLEVDFAFQRICYCNGSHEAPIVLPYKNTSEGNSNLSFKKSDLRFLNEIHGPRLGERKNASYKESYVDFHWGDSLFLYTDGLLDCRNKADKVFSEKGLIQSLLKVKPTSRPKDISDAVQTDVSQHRSNQSLPDDISFLIVGIKQP